MKMKVWLVLSLCSVLSWPGLALQAAAAPAEPVPNVAGEGVPAADNLRDPEALESLQQATEFLAGLPRFQFKATISYDVIQEDGRRLQFEKHGEIFLQRPDHLFADVFLDDGRHRQFWFDGKTLSIAERVRNLHTQIKAPPTIDGLLDMLEVLLNDPMPLADLLYNDLGPLEQRALEADIVGDGQVHGKPCRHLAFRGATVDWQIWVEKGGTPFIRKLAVNYREMPGAPQYVAWIDEWQTPQRFSEGQFQFTAPAGSEFIEILMPVSMRSGKGGWQ